MCSFQSFVHIICINIFITKHNEAQTMTSLIESFSGDLESLMCDGLRLGGDKCSNDLYGVQDFIYSFDSHFENNKQLDASVDAQSIIARLDKKLNQRASFLRNLSHVIQTACVDYGNNDESDESLTDFEDLYFAGNTERSAVLPPNMATNDVYGTSVSVSSSTIKIPNGIDTSQENIQKDAILSQLMDDTMVHLYETHCVDDEGNDEYCMMYFGSVNGVFRQFPGVENKKVNGAYKNYDPRFRPWYVSAATGNKDVVILLDMSGSMKSEGRKALAKEAVVSVLNTLGSSSFVNVVAFSDVITLSCFGTELVAATARNVAELVDFVEGLNPSGQTDFSIAFDKAFTILSQGTSCQTSIIFLTDGITKSTPYSIIEHRNTDDIAAVVFSYTLGSGADPVVATQIANMTGGIYAHIDDSDANLITTMSQYYLYYAFGGVSDDDGIVLTSPYLSFSTGVVMCTMAMPVYIDNTYFVGVVATDLPLSLISDAIGDITIGRKSYSFVMNEESEVIIHPLIPNAFELFDSDSEYRAIFVDDVEPEAFGRSVMSKMILREDGMVRVSASVKLPAGDVEYNGYIEEDAELLYIYGGVGPAALSIAIVVYSDDDVAAPYVPSFGMNSRPSTDCDEDMTEIRNETDLSNCVAPFNLFHRIDIMTECQSSWLETAQVLNGSDPANADLRYNSFYEGKLYSAQYPIFYLQSGLFEHQADALSVDPSCDSLEELHKLTNGLGAVDSGDLPFGGFRREVSQNIMNSIISLTSLHEFWKPAFLADDSLFVSMWFGHYQGLHISYPGKTFGATYNNARRSWYQRAISYPDLMVWTTPDLHATTHKLVTGASTVVYAPYSEYPFGVLGFNFEFSAFVTYWKDAMSDLCDANNPCYLFDSSAFCLYYEGMEDDVSDEDIGRKFLGDLEPTLMQSLLDRGFFLKDSDVNFEQDTTDITYIQDPLVTYATFAAQETEFASNDGVYTVHRVSKTNLFVIYITGYDRTQYPTSCPATLCADVESPGCVKTSAGECVSATRDVCDEPDTTVSNEDGLQCSVISAIGLEVLQDDEQSDMCASNFMYDEEEEDDDDAAVREGYAILYIVIALNAVVT
eukprot:319343_1